ncbi:MAG: NAD(P)-dependent dehydrogenase (short-subunit alcohol dehydrogenase family) [Roseivirga sp.]|jgi:NAD(P)-dependent dehydrogenase (short-subunit alcohol dehydrogenase family)
MTKLKDKVAVITGGSTGIGLATAKTFLAEGAKVIITGRTQSTLDAAVTEIDNPNLTAITSDTSKLEDISALVEKVTAQFGQVDILFANAGIAWFAPIEASDEAFFDAQFNTNVKGLFFTVQKFLPIFNDGGTIVLNASAVIHKGFLNGSIYSATKSAVRSFARTLSAELAPRKIRVNAVSPGPIETPIYSKMGMTEEQMNGMAAGMIDMVPVKRFGTSEEVAKAVLFLASDDSSYVVGEEILVDGGIATI